MNSSKLRGYLTGLIFGDGHIDKGVTKRAFYLRSINKDFVEKIYNDLSSCTPFEISAKCNPEHYSHGCNHKTNWEIKVAANPYFAKKYHHFYDDYRHRFASAEALKWLNDVGLANWYMSDGYVCLVGKESGTIKDRRVEICTDRYSEDTIVKMIDMLEKSFGVSSTIIKRNHTHRIRIKSDSYERFFWIVYPHMVDSMKYKLYLGYRFQPKWMSDEMWQIQIDLQSAISLTNNVEG